MCSGLHVVEIMEEFSYLLFMLTTRIPFRIFFKQCKRLAAEYSTHDDAMKLFNAVCCRIEQTGTGLNFWLSDDVRLASVGQSTNDLVSMYNVIKSMVQQSLDNSGSEQHLGRQATEHYTTIWQLKEDFAQMIRVFWRENATEPAYVMFVFDLHQKLAYLNVKWTLGLPIRMRQEDDNLRDRGIDQRDAREMLDLTANVPDVFSQQYIDAMRALRSYFSQELQGSLSGKEHLEQLSLVRWLSDNAKCNVIRPTTNEVRLSSIGNVSQPQAVLRLLEPLGLQLTGSVYDDAQQIATSSSFILQGGDNELQLALEMSKQETPVQQDDHEDQMRYALAVSASESTAQGAHSEVGVSTDRTISRNAYDQYGSAVHTPLPSSVILHLGEHSSDGFDRQRGSQRSRESQQRHQLEPQPRHTQGHEVPQQQHHGSQHGSDSGLVTSGGSSSAQQSTPETGMHAPHAASLTTSQLSSGRSTSALVEPSYADGLPRDVSRDTDGRTSGRSSPPTVKERSFNEDSDSGESKMTIPGDESDDEGRQPRQTSWDPEHKLKVPVNAPHSPESLPVGQPSATVAFGEETMMEHASQLLDLLRQQDYVQVNRLLKDLQGNVQQRLNLRSLGRDFLLEVVCQYAKEEDLAEMVEKLVRTDRVDRETLETICEKLDISVSGRSDEILKHLIGIRGRQQ